MEKFQYIFVDTEFTDLLDPHLISIGMVTEDGRNEIYLECSDYDKETESPFVKAVVLPLLQTKGFPINIISQKLFHWLAMLPISNGTYKIICDYMTDWELLIDVVDNLPPSVDPDVELLYSALDTKSTLYGMKTGDIIETSIRARNAFKMGVDEYFYSNRLKQHHALNDAKANRYGWLIAMQSFGAKTF